MPALWRGTGVGNSGACSEPRGVHGVPSSIEREDPHSGRVEKYLEPVLLRGDKDPAAPGMGNLLFRLGAGEPCPVQTEQACQKTSHDHNDFQYSTHDNPSHLQGQTKTTLPVRGSRQPND